MHIQFMYRRTLYSAMQAEMKQTASRYEQRNNIQTSNKRQSTQDHSEQALTGKDNPKCVQASTGKECLQNHISRMALQIVPVW